MSSDTVAACPMCGAYGSSSLAQPPALLAVCDVLVVHALETVGKRIVRAERSRYSRLGTRPWHQAHTMWTPDTAMVDKALIGSWDVIPALLDNHGCCGVTSRQVESMVDQYVRDLLVVGKPHNMSDLRYRFEKFLGITLAEPVPYEGQPRVSA